MSNNNNINCEWEPNTNNNNNCELTTSNHKRCSKVTRFKGSLSDDRLIKCRSKYLDIDNNEASMSDSIFSRQNTPMPSKNMLQNDDDDEFSPPPLPFTSPPDIINATTISTDFSPKIEKFSATFEKTISFHSFPKTTTAPTIFNSHHQEFLPIAISRSTENLMHPVLKPIPIYPNGSLSKSVQDLSTMRDRNDDLHLYPYCTTQSSDDLFLPDIDGIRRPLTAKQKYKKIKAMSHEDVSAAHKKPLPLPRKKVLLGVQEDVPKNSESKKLVYVLDRKRNEFVLEDENISKVNGNENKSGSLLSLSKLKLSLCGINTKDSDDDEQYKIAENQLKFIEEKQILPNWLESTDEPKLSESNSTFYVQLMPTTSSGTSCK